MRLGLITTLAFGLMVASCGTQEEAVETQGPLSSQQTVTVFTLFDEVMEPMLHFGWSADYGWHFSMAKQESIDVVSQFTSQDAQSFGDAFEGAEGGSAALRFSATAAVVSGFRAASAAASGFSGSSGGAGGFSASSGGAGGFSAGLSAGPITCDLSGLCGLVGALCAFGEGLSEAAGGGTVNCQPVVNECVSNISAAAIPAAFAPFICVLSDFFGCVGNALATASSPEAFGANVEGICAPELQRLQTIGLETFADFGGEPEVNQNTGSGIPQ